MQRFPFAVAAWAAGVLGALALLLTSVGLYGVVSYSMVQRRREIGVHLALGATPVKVIRRILGDAWRPVIAGLAVGIPICVVLSRIVNAAVLGIRAFDPWAFFAVAVLLASIAALACTVPARRAVRLDPMASLREN